MLKVTKLTTTAKNGKNVNAILYFLKIEETQWNMIHHRVSRQLHTSYNNQNTQILCSLIASS